MFSRLLFLINFGIFTFVTSQKYIEYPHHPCKSGDVVENECNQCVCNQKYVYECYEKPCKVPAQRANNEQELQCLPRVVYVRQDVVCICNKHGKWPHAKCENALQSLQPTDIKSPNLIRCEPNTYVKLECNVCRCNANGEIDRKHCTKNNCTQIYIKSSRKSLPLPRSVHGHCEPKNWYSLAPCQFCFCVNTNKLVCNTEDFYVNKLQLGKYNLNICGKDLIKEAIELIPAESNLRVNADTKRTTTTTPVPVTKMTYNNKPTQKSHAINNVPMIIREVITHKHNKDQEGSTEYEDVEEEKPSNSKSSLAISENKADQPLDEVENALVDEKRNEDYEEEEENVDDSVSKYANVKPNNMKHSINVDKIIINVDKSNKSSVPPTKTLRDRDAEDNYVLDVFVPNVLESLFNMQMRKSMLKVSSNSDCIPGTKETVDCNTCYCLNNGKKLCTSNVCQ